MKKGFTQIELILTIIILAIFFSMGTVVYGGFAKKDQLLIEERKIEGVINEARMKTLAGFSLGDFQSQNFGVHFTSSGYVLFPGLIYNQADSRNQEFSLPDSLEINEISLPSDMIVFEKITGEVNNFNPVQNYLVLGDKNSHQERKISLNQLGVVTIEE